MLCNCCGGTEFVAQGSRPNVRCTTCHSVERTRAMCLVLEALELPKPGSRVLHFAPEFALHQWLSARVGEGYEAVARDPGRYKWAAAKKIDLVSDAEKMESGTYDLILHSHLMQQIPCNVTAVLFHLHRALTPDGMQICCIPFLPTRFEESLEPLSAQEATLRFGHQDHVRRFGALDASQTIGMIFDVSNYDLRNWVSEADLVKYNVPEYAWTGLTPHTILALEKDDIKLRADVLPEVRSQAAKPAATIQATGDLDESDSMALADVLDIPRDIWLNPATSYCPICEKPVDKFKSFGRPARENAQCPHCGALERHRLVWCFFKAWTNLFDGRPKELLHVAPERTMGSRIASIPGIASLTADLESPLAMVKMDLTDIQYPEGSFDIILCSHVLEHIPDDGKAMREMLRVLKPGGWVAVQVPVYGETTYEDWSVVTQADRLKHFGQEDHVRKYGADIAGRLRDAGFEVEHRRPMADLGPEAARKMRLKDQDIFYCRKA